MSESKSDSKPSEPKRSEENKPSRAKSKSTAITPCVAKAELRGGSIIVEGLRSDEAYKGGRVPPAVRCRQRTFPVGKGVELSVESLSDADVEALTHHPRLKVTKA